MSSDLDRNPPGGAIRNAPQKHDKRFKTIQVRRVAATVSSLENPNIESPSVESPNLEPRPTPDYHGHRR
jgi:hypothetical protein